MKVLIITQQTIPHSGGLSTHIETLSNSLQANGHEVKLIQGGSFQPKKLTKGLRLIATLGDRDKFVEKNFNDLLNNLSNNIQKEINEFQPDIIHSHDVYASYAALQSNNIEIDKLIQTIHGPALYEAQMGGVDKKPRFKNIIIKCENETFKKINNFIAVDTGQANILINDYNVNKHKISIIYNGVDVDEVKKFTANPIVNFKITQPYFLVPRRLVEKTGVRYAIEALAKLKNKNVFLVIAGHGPQLDALQNLANNLKISSRVKFLGAIKRESLMYLYSRAIAVIVPSIPASGVIEATSLSVTEAMAAGTVPIASDIGGLAELIDNDLTGILVPPANSSELAIAMDEISINENKRNNLIKNASKKVVEDYSSRVWLNKIINRYSNMLVK
ncbi:glycosyltransferase family 4 protein [Oceanihabitans sediminis]|uniref:glycosyltransferase family 4 protein n=1 Tax=Oceanihabitans sediminis TaxID=1812012 RepID=UPI00299DB6FC|nr:glycosyltransferase family 4 protein [Oceanihabitans sediminis]MDX1774862.1 glycosyltransferase family 4 protein [Oceanihabitans sediminis]